MIRSLDILSNICLLLDTNSVNNVALLSKENSEQISLLYLKTDYWKRRVELYVGRQPLNFLYNWIKIFSLLVKEKNKYKPYNIRKLFRYNDEESVLLIIYLGLNP